MKVLISLDAVVSKGRHGERNVIVSFAADTKAEVNDTTGENIENLSENDKLCLGTTVITADGYAGVLSSEGEYTWKKWSDE